MRSLILPLLLATLAIGSCNETVRDRGSDPPTEAPRDTEVGQDVAAWERAVGESHGMTPEAVRQWMENMRSSPVFQNRFLGVHTLQNPSDAWIIMEIMHEVKPDLIVETGTFRGGSAVLWAIILEHIVPDGQVVTIDIEDKRQKVAINLPIAQERVHFLLGSSTAPEIVAEVHRRAEGKRVLVLLDALHSKEHVEAELAAYAPLVPVGGYLIVQDTPSGPREAIEEFLAENDDFVADRTRERYPDTNSVKGYLRRVR